MALLGAARPALVAALLLGGEAVAGRCPDVLIDEAFHLAFPVAEMVRTRAMALGRTERPEPPQPNRFSHRPRLSTPADRGVTTPNVDTLYSSAWLDLSAGPVTLSLPEGEGRYVSVAIMDMAGDHVALLHPAPGRQRRIVLRPPGAAPAAPGEDALAMPVVRGWAIARVFVRSADDLPAARAVQQAIRLEGPVPPAPAPAPPGAGPEAILARANGELAAGPAPPGLAGRLPALACTGLGQGADAWQRLPEGTRAQWAARAPQLEAILRLGFATEARAGNWHRAHPATGTASAPAEVRAAVALSGLGALPAAEVLYFRTDRDAAGHPLSGARRYRLTLPPDLPAEAFWSVTLYAVEPDGRLFLAANPLGRHALNSASTGLRREADGSVRLEIGRSAPADQANWLPAPAGPIALVVRLYRPTKAAAAGGFEPPAVIPD